MDKKSMLEGKRILIVDDEPDVLESLEQLLVMCDIDKASTFEEAKKKLETKWFDIVILDIMGVDGYKLLEIANQRDLVAVMLTAHALSPEDTVRSYKEGAASYIPKEKMAEIETFLTDILEAQMAGKSFWWRWLDRLGAYYDKKFGEEWKKTHKDFWDEVQL
ncbi:MAG: response regulator [Deltaproteobacteria bacterium]|nr:response regulator [Deltaproteobacteria bacterium]